MRNPAWEETKSQEDVKYVHLAAECNSQGKARDQTQLIFAGAATYTIIYDLKLSENSSVEL